VERDKRAFSGRRPAGDRGRPSKGAKHGGAYRSCDGRFTRIDKEAALAELAASLDRPRSSEEMRRRELAREVFPHVKAFYDGYLPESAPLPFYRTSARR
jgi:hypothetical protein